MPNVYREITDEISATMHKGFDFNAAFLSVMQHYKGLDWSTTRREVGSLLGSRKKRKPPVVTVEKKPRVKKLSLKAQKALDAKEEAEMLKDLDETLEKEFLADAEKAHFEYLSTVDERDW